MTAGVRREVVKNAEVLKLLNKKNELITQLKAMQAEIDKIANDGTTLAGKIQAVKDKAIPKMEVIATKFDLKRNIPFKCPTCCWEVVESFQVEGDEVVAFVVDLIDREKERILEQDEKEKQAQRESPDNHS